MYIVYIYVYNNIAIFYIYIYIYLYIYIHIHSCTQHTKESNGFYYSISTQKYARVPDFLLIHKAIKIWLKLSNYSYSLKKLMREHS